MGINNNFGKNKILLGAENKSDNNDDGLFMTFFITNEHSFITENQKR